MYESNFCTSVLPVYTHTNTVAPGTFLLFANVVQCGRHRLAFFGHVRLCIGWPLMDGGCTPLTMKVLSVSALRVNGVLSICFVLFFL